MAQALEQVGGGLMSGEPLHAAIQRQIFAEFSGDLEPADREALRAHVEGCDPCARLYERCARAERALSPMAQLDRGLARLIPEAAPQPALLTQPRAAVATLALAASLMVVLVERSGPPESPLEARGEQSRIDPGYTLRVLGSRQEQPGRPVIFEAKNQALTPEDEVLILATCLPEARLLTVVATAADGTRKVLVENAELQPGSEDQQVGAVTTQWLEGQVRFVAAFSAKPVDPRWLKPELAAADLPGVSVRTVLITVGNKEKRQ